MIPGSVRYIASEHLSRTVTLKLTRWQQFRAWLAALCDRADVLYPWARVQGSRVEPDPNLYLIQPGVFIAHPATLARIKALASALLLLLLFSPALVHAQTYPDLGQALYAISSRTVWVNSFDPTQPYLAHGVFSPSVPIGASIGASGYDARYGMTLLGSGSVSVDASGHIQASGVARGPGTDGSLSVDLMSNGNLLDSAKLPWSCPGGDCPWSAHFQTTAGPAVSLRIYRHVEGSLCGGELNIDLNGECHDKLVSRFGLPAAYRFTSTDALDAQYVQVGATTALCALVKPLCALPAAPPADPPVTPPAPDPCASGCSAGCPSSCQGGTFPPTLPPPAPVCPAGTSCRAECPAPPPEKACPPAPACPEAPSCPACPAPVTCPSCPPPVVCPAPDPCPACPSCPPPPVHAANVPPADVLATLKALAKGQTVKNSAKVKAAALWVLAHPGVQP